MSSSRVRRVQDSVHGLMEFTGLEAVVIDVLRSMELQRLRKIRQLGLSHLVFPGAEHSRLAHSIGAAHLAVRFGRRLAESATEYFSDVLSPDESSIRDFALAALCHDLGHGPLSHAFEREIIGHSFDRTAWCNKLGIDLSASITGKLQWHEIVTQGLLRSREGELHKLLEQQESGLSDRIANLLIGKYELSYLPRLISSDIDVDRSDYIRRDTHSTGVAYGRYDLDWMVSTICLGHRDAGGKREWFVGFDERKSLRVIEQFLIARRALFDTVYYHKSVRAAEGMVALFLRRLRKVLKDGITVEVERFVTSLMEAIRGNPLSTREILQLDDYTLFVLIDQIASSDIPDITVKDLAHRIRSRNLFKRIPIGSEIVSRFLITDHGREQLLEEIKPFVPGDPQFYLVRDEMDFAMLFADDQHASLLVEDSGECTFLKSHKNFLHYIPDRQQDVRIFTVKEAIPAVESLIKRTIS